MGKKQQSGAGQGWTDEREIGALYYESEFGSRGESAMLSL